MNLRSSIKSPRLKMIDEHVHNIVMSLSLNKFPLSSPTHQNLFKLLFTVQAPNKDQFKEAYSQKALLFVYHRILLYDSYKMHFVK